MVGLFLVRSIDDWDIRQQLQQQDSTVLAKEQQQQRQT
jgi:hypothetical protein